jgi:type III restriction enzyme
VDQWRRIPNPNDWKVTPDTQRLPQHWRHHKFSDVHPFFCQIEAVETAIWLTEVAPQWGKTGKQFLEHLANANHAANPELMRRALKLASGAGKTTVMAMIVAWQTINAVRQPGTTRFTRRLSGGDARPHHPRPAPDAPAQRPLQLLLRPRTGPQRDAGRMDKAKIVISNYHAFQLRERIELSKGGRSLLQSRREEFNTLETEGQMIQRVMPSLCYGTANRGLRGTGLAGGQLALKSWRRRSRADLVEASREAGDVGRIPVLKTSSTPPMDKSS